MNSMCLSAPNHHLFPANFISFYACQGPWDLFTSHRPRILATEVEGVKPWKEGGRA